MDDTILGLIGIAMFYSWGHFAIIQHKLTWNDRTQYQKVVSVFAYVTFLLYLLGTLTA